MRGEIEAKEAGPLRFPFIDYAVDVDGVQNGGCSPSFLLSFIPFRLEKQNQKRTTTNLEGKPNIVSILADLRPIKFDNKPTKKTDRSRRNNETHSKQRVILLKKKARNDPRRDEQHPMEREDQREASD